MPQYEALGRMWEITGYEEVRSTHRRENHTCKILPQFSHREFEQRWLTGRPISAGRDLTEL